MFSWLDVVFIVNSAGISENGISIIAITRPKKVSVQTFWKLPCIKRTWLFDCFWTASQLTISFILWTYWIVLLCSSLYKKHYIANRIYACRSTTAVLSVWPTPTKESFLCMKLTTCYDGRVHSFSSMFTEYGFFHIYTYYNYRRQRSKTKDRGKKLPTENGCEKAFEQKCFGTVLNTLEQWLKKKTLETDRK